MNKKIITDLGMLLRGSLPISNEPLSVEKIDNFGKNMSQATKQQNPNLKDLLIFNILVSK